MDHSLLYNVCIFVGAIPYIPVVAILVHFFIRRALWRHKIGRAMPGFCPSSAALGMVFLFALSFYRPRLQHLIEARQVMDVVEDDEGDPETPARGMDRQLKRIRRGEPVDSLILRL